MIKNIWNKPIKRFTLIVLVSCILSFILYGPFLYQFITKGIVFSGSGDGFRQMMPFQMYLYEHFTSLKDFMMLHLDWEATMLNHWHIIIHYLH